MRDINREVELVDKNFEFRYSNGKPSGHYARGKIIKWYDDDHCLVELFCNGLRYTVHKSIIRYL